MKPFLVQSRNDIGDVISTNIVAANNSNDALNLVCHTYSYDMNETNCEIIPNLVVAPNILISTILL